MLISLSYEWIRTSTPITSSASDWILSEFDSSTGSCMVEAIYVKKQLARVGRDVTGVGQNPASDFDRLLVKFLPPAPLSLSLSPLLPYFPSLSSPVSPPLYPATCSTSLLRLSLSLSSSLPSLSPSIFLSSSLPFPPASLSLFLLEELSFLLMKIWPTLLDFDRIRPTQNHSEFGWIPANKTVKFLPSPYGQKRSRYSDLCWLIVHSYLI